MVPGERGEINADEEGSSEEEDDDKTSEEARKVYKRRHCDRPPTERDRVDHARTHLPYRTWCPACVAGRGRASPHPRSPQDETVGEMVAYDYCFLRNGPNEACAPTLVAKDRRTKLLMSHVVPCKGADQEWVAAQTLRDLERLGHYGDIVLRSDGEPALVDLMKEIEKGRGNRRTVIEHSAPGDSQGNGFIERGVRSVEEMARVLKLDLEHRLTTRLEVTCPVFAWLVEHAVDLHNKFLVGSDGKTAYERLKGKKYHGEVLPCASPVMLRVSEKVLGGVMAERWYEGVWLGKRFHTEEHLVARATDGVVVRTRSVQSLPNAISMDLLNKIVGAPWAPAGVMKGNQEVVCPARLRPEDPVEIYEPFVPRNMKITKAIINKFGYSRRCPRCRALTQGEANSKSEAILSSKHALKLQRSAKHVISQERLNDLHRQLDTTVVPRWQ